MSIRLINNLPKCSLPVTTDWTFVAHGYYDPYGGTPPYENNTPTYSASGNIATSNWNGAYCDDGDITSGYTEIYADKAINKCSAKRLYILINAGFSKYASNSIGGSGFGYSIQIGGETIMTLGGGAVDATITDTYSGSYLLEQTTSSTITVTKLSATSTDNIGTASIVTLTSLTGSLRDVKIRINGSAVSQSSNGTDFRATYSINVSFIPISV